ncbi:MAG: HNH endonuclease [Leptolyngbyaceae cyanobacterium CRU_2_3]|nr:HNH endonuclease [Leptolyngbyaceae cyanobacterium CRU_2_3]
MERPYINQELRRLVADRANHLCEYCLMHEQDTVFGCTIDHVISLKHGGSNDASNLAYACVFCNRYKGSDIGSIFWQTREFTRFYNPRSDRWSEHFRLQDATLEPLSTVGEVTARILDFNDSDRLLERQLLINRNKYPHPAALRRIEESRSKEDG